MPPPHSSSAVYGPEYGRFIIQFKGPAVWGMIPLEMKELKSFDRIKTKLISCGYKPSATKLEKSKLLQNLSTHIINILKGLERHTFSFFLKID